MWKKFLIVSAQVAVVACLAWASNEPWKTKSYQQWDQKDVQQVLNDSPWVKVESVPATWKAGALAPMGEPSGQAGGYGQSGVGASGGAPGSAGTMAGGQGGAMGPGGTGAPGGAGTPGGPPLEAPPEGQGLRMASFVIRWNSSKTVREALGRNAILSGKATEADVAKFVAQEPADFEIFVAGRDMSPFASANEEELKTRAYLETRQSKQKIAPANVTIQRSPDNKTVNFLVFSFVRKIAANQPFITPKDKSVEFECKLKDLNLHTSFDLHKMVSEKGSDL